MTEITEARAQTEQQIRQGLLKDLFRTASEKARQAEDERDMPVYEGKLINGVIANDIIIKSANARFRQGRMLPMIEISPPSDKSSAKALFISMEMSGIMVAIWRMREKGFMPKYTYGLAMQGSGEKYQRFLDESYGDHLDIASAESIRKLTANIRNWKKA